MFEYIIFISVVVISLHALADDYCYYLIGMLIQGHHSNTPIFFGRIWNGICRLSIIRKSASSVYFPIMTFSTIDPILKKYIPEEREEISNPCSLEVGKLAFTKTTLP